MQSEKNTEWAFPKSDKEIYPLEAFTKFSNSAFKKLAVEAGKLNFIVANTAADFNTDASF